MTIASYASFSFELKCTFKEFIEKLPERSSHGHFKKSRIYEDDSAFLYSYIKNGYIYSTLSVCLMPDGTYSIRNIIPQVYGDALSVDEYNNIHDLFVITILLSLNVRDHIQYKFLSSVKTKELYVDKNEFNVYGCFTKEKLNLNDIIITDVLVTDNVDKKYSFPWIYKENFKKIDQRCIVLSPITYCMRYNNFNIKLIAMLPHEKSWFL